jgi:hypothetical protein
MWSVGRTKHLHPELELHPLGDVEGPKDAGIQIEKTRPANNVTAS